METLALSIPAFLYILQNNLQYVAVANLSPAIFQVLYQFKVVTAAIFSALLLNRSLFIHQWASITSLMAGLGLVQISQRSQTTTTHIPVMNIDGTNPVGIMAVILASLTSGLAGVLVEKMLKGSKTSSPLWVRYVL